MRNTQAALHWIIELLKSQSIPYEIDGGLAAEMYGSDRKLADIDINISTKKDLDKLLPVLKNFLVFGPTLYSDEHWRIYMVTVNYSGQNIDIGVLEGAKYYDNGSREWVEYPQDLSDTRLMKYEDLELPVINEIKLLIYKDRLRRGVDKKDYFGMMKQFLKGLR